MRGVGIIGLKGTTRTGTHVELSETKVDRVGSGIDGRLQGGIAPGGRQNLNVLILEFSDGCRGRLNGVFSMESEGGRQ